MGSNQATVCYKNLIHSLLLSPFLAVFLLAHPLQIDGSIVLGIVIDVVYGGFLFGIIILTKFSSHQSAH